MSNEPPEGRRPEKALARLRQMRKEGSLASSRPRRARPTRAMIRAMCSDCLNLKGNRASGFDCGIPSCPLWPAMPWQGKDMPTHLKPDAERNFAATRGAK